MENSSVAGYKANNQGLIQNYSCDRSTFGHIFLPVSYSILFLLVVAGNMCLLLHYLRKKKSSCKIFTANLAVLDLSMALTLPQTVDYYLQGGDWRFGEALCTARVALFYGNLYGGSLFMLCISVDRLVAVRYPQAYEKWTERPYCRLVCLGVWLIIATLFLWGSVSLRPLNLQPDGRMACGDTFSDKQWQRLWLLLTLGTVMGFILPYAAILFCYALIARQLAKTPAARQRWKSKSLRATITLIAIMTICFLPFHTVQMVKVVHHLNNDLEKAGSFGICLCQRSLILMACLNSALDPFVYYFLSYSFKINQLCQWRCS